MAGKRCKHSGVARKVSAIVLGVGAGFGSLAVAGEAGFDVGYAGQYSDNIDRLPEGGRRELINSALFGVGYQENSAELAAQVTLQAEYRDYRHETYPNQTLYYGNAAAVWNIEPRRFLWSLEDRYAEVPLDAARALTPSNRQGVNVFDTGPDYITYLNPVNAMVFGARVGNTKLQGQNGDHNRYTGIWRWRYQPDPTTTASLNLESQKTDFINQPAPPAASEDLRRDDLYLRLDRRNPVSRVRLDLGETKIKRDQTDGMSKNLARFSWAVQLTTESIVGVGAAREYSDIGSSFLSRVTDPTEADPMNPPASAVPADVATSDIFYGKRIQMFYRTSGSDVEVDASGYWRELVYETMPENRLEEVAHLRIAYNNTATLTTAIIGEGGNYEYRSIERSDRERSYAVQVSYRMNPTLTVAVEARRTDRTSTDPAAEFRENRALLSLVYSTNRRLAPMAQR
jgi:hypothetical protein